MFFNLTFKEVKSLRLNFYRNIYYTRFLDYFVLGLSGSDSFCFGFNKELNMFIRTNLRFDISFNNLFLISDTILVFANFNIKLLKKLDKNNNFFAFLKSSKKYFGKIMYRLEIYKLRFSKQAIKSLNFELLEYSMSLIGINSLITESKDLRKIWFYVFQLECIRATQLDKLLFHNDSLGLLPSSIFIYSKSFFSTTYYRYKFSLYNLKLRLALKKILKGTISLEGSSIHPIRLYVDKFFEEYKKRLFFIYNNIFFTSTFGKRRNLNSFSEIFGLRISKKEEGLFFDRQLKNYSNYSFLDVLKSSNKEQFLDIFAYMPGCLEKLRLEGFLHKFKYRSISNSSCLNFEDSYIIRIFGTISYSYLTWFRCCSNFYSVKILISFLRESCFLTLSRKHNKTKNWVYNLYSNDLIVLQDLSYTKSFFPSRILLSKMKKKFILSRKNFLFDEKFFLF